METDDQGRAPLTGIVWHFCQEAERTPLPPRHAEQAWRLRWFGLFGCVAAKAFAASLLEMQGPVGADGSTPASHEVEGDFRHAGDSG